MTIHHVCQSQFPLPNIPLSGFMESPCRQTHPQAAWTPSQPSEGGGQASPQPQPPHTAWSDPPSRGQPQETTVAIISTYLRARQVLQLPLTTLPAHHQHHKLGRPPSPPPSTPHAACRRELAAPELPKPLALACLGALQLRNPPGKPGHGRLLGSQGVQQGRAPQSSTPGVRAAPAPRRGGYTPEGREG